MSQPPQLPPSNETSEQGLLGCCIYDQQNVSRAFDAGIRPEAFFNAPHRDLWHALRTMDAAGDFVDNVTLGQFLRGRNELEAIGGPVYINTCLEQAPVASNIDMHLRLVLEKWTLRRILKATEAAASASMEKHAAPAAIIESLCQSLEEARTVATPQTISAKELALDWLASVEERQEQRRQGKEITGVPTGFGRLDNMSSGLYVGGLNIIAARPSVGKTAMLCNIVLHACIRAGIKTTVFSLETTAQKLVDRIAASACDISAGTFRDGDQQSERNMTKMAAFSAKLAHCELTLSKDVFDCGSICSMIARHAELGTKLFLVDYVQIVGTSGRGRNEPRTYAVGSVATELKQAAIRHNVCIVALAQLKRSDDESSYPTANDIADSDQLFRDADLMWLLHRPDRIKEPTEGVVVVAKNKDGEVGAVHMTYTPQFLRWEERRDDKV